MTCETCHLDRLACTCFYIFSLKWTRGEPFLTFWGPDNSGYVSHMAGAGRYAKERVEAKPAYYNNRRSTIAMPCVAVDREAVLVIPDHALARLVPNVRFKPILERHEDCEKCGNPIAPDHNLGLEIVGRKKRTA